MVTVSIFESIDDLPTAVADRVTYASQRSIFFCSEWYGLLQNLLRRSGLRPRYYVASDNTGDFVLFCAAADDAGVLHSLSNFYALEFGPVFSSAECDQAVLLSAVFGFIRKERPAWRRLDIRLLSREKGIETQVDAAMRSAGYSTSAHLQYDNQFKPVVGVDFETYYASLPSRARNTIKRKEKKLKKLDFRLEIYTEIDRQKFDDYMEIYNKSWKGNELSEEFVYDFYKTFSGLGLARVGLVYLDNRPIAGQVWLLSGDVAIIYKLAYDEDFKEYSAGSILTKYLMEHVIDQDGVAEIDYGVGSEAYKKDWMDSVRTLYGLQAFDPATVSGMLQLLRVGVGNLIRRARRPAQA